MDSQQYSECYVAFLDILGFKNRIGDDNCQEIVDIFSNIKKPIKAVFLGEKPVVHYNDMDAVKIKVMSDSVCLYIDVLHEQRCLH